MKKPRVNPSIVLREEFEGQVFLYDPDTGDRFPMNAVGTFVWKQLDGRHTTGQIVEALIEEFEAVPQSATEDVTAFLNELKKRGFIS